MSEWLAENYGTLIVLAAVALAVAGAAFALIKGKKKGKSVCSCGGCCGNCCGCPMAGKAVDKEKNEVK